MKFPASKSASQPLRKSSGHPAVAKRVVHVVVVAVSVLASLLLVAWLVLQWAILPRIEYWRADVERRAAQALGVPVSIGAIEVTDGRSTWHWARAIELRDVVIHRKPGADAGAAPAEALRLPSVRAALSPASLLPGWDGRWRLRLEQLLIVGAELDVRRETDGRILVAGLPLSEGHGDEGAGADWFFSQPEFAIRGGRVVWTDALRGAPPLALDAVDLVVRNGVRQHAMRLDATPPAALGERFSLRGEFTQPLIGELGKPGAAGTLLARPGDWRRWRGTAYAELPGADIEPLGRYIELPAGIARGTGAVRLWVDVKRGEPVAATVDMALRDVALRPYEDGEALAFARIDGRLSGRLDEDGAFFGQAGKPSGGQLRAQQFGFASADGLAWPAGDFTLDWRRAADGGWAGGAFKAPRIDLGLLADLAARLPARWVAPEVRRQLESFAPAGIASAVDLRWDGALPSPRRYTVKASVAGLRLASEGAEAQAAGASSPVGSRPVADAAAAAPAATSSSAAASAPLHLGRPGLAGADVDFSATESGGEARILLTDGSLEFPGVFDEPRVPIDRLEGLVNWRIDAAQDGAPAGLELRAREVRFSNADAQGEFQARWTRAPASASAALPALGSLAAVLRRPAADAAKPGAKAASEAHAAKAGGGPGSLELSGRLDRAKAQSIARYLPLGLPEHVRRYVERAVQGGVASAVNFKVRGDLQHFPFGPKTGGPVRPGEFRIAARLDDVRFAYLPGDADWQGAGSAPPSSEPAAGDGAGGPREPQRPWPAFTGVQGDLVFDRQSMELRNLQGRLGTVGSGAIQFTQVRGGIPDMSHQAALTIEGQARGPLADALSFVAATPVGGWIGGALDSASVPLTSPRGAPIELKLALDIPLQHAADSKVRGSVVLAGNDLRLRPDVPAMQNARARIAFTESSLTLAGGAVRMLGGDTSIEGGTQPDGSLRFSAQGTATAEGLRGSDVPVLARPALALSGQSAYRVALGFVRGQPEWQVTSNLVGMGIDLPAPLRKGAEQALPLRVQLGAGGVAPAGTQREMLRAELGGENARVLQAAWLREPGPRGTRVLRGAIGVQDALPTLQEGVVAQLAMDRLDLDAWRAAIDKLDPAPQGAVAAPREAGAGSEAAAYLPSLVTLRARQPDIAGRRLNRVNAVLTRGSGADDGVWRANVDAAELLGDLEYRPPGSAAGPRSADTGGRVQARLQRLVLPRQEFDAVGSLLDQASPSRLPALDITVDELELNGKRFGRVEIDALNRPAENGSGAGEWRLNRFRMTTPEAQLTATGSWGAAEAGASALARRRAQMDFQLDIADGGALAARMGQKDVLRGAKGRLSGQVGWQGSPLAIDHPSLGGKVRVEVEGGQFLKADPGIAKLLGVLSLQALPRRLLLDFRDVFEQGFAFDSVDGDVDIAEGVASTRNLRMKGVQATVLMEGRADIARETQDLRVWVVPEINAGAASLAVAVINPAVGIGSFLAQLFLRKPLIEAGTREFHITGPWADPKVDRIERARTDPPPEAEAPPVTAPAAPFSPPNAPAAPQAPAPAPRAAPEPRPSESAQEPR